MDSQELPDNDPIFIPTECKIVSSSVDIRSSKVEYRDHSLGQMQFAMAEAPNEALPLSCRPNFGSSWLTKDKFKVNETYDCWYMWGIPTVQLYNDGFFL
ncbi:uncharacterized protein LOC120128566 isoform X3 [Hibiscus syriacus]|uniref:uncharacterized protein LOC120128566 isoform X3 n=1 Tax=Hibiscus syriacus TaxID=106335 RepID=UPI0019229211|nr:uncharacterized protein LOC120128566 isoform X3 [Hibiscus syriacus]